MQYTRTSFSAAVSNGSISDTAYEVAVGLRCAKCARKLADKHVCRGPLVIPANKPSND